MYLVDEFFCLFLVLLNKMSVTKNVILKKDKGRGVIILDRSKYMEKYFSILSTIQFAEIDNDPTVYIEGKVQKTLKKIKKQTAIICLFKNLFDWLIT